MRNFYRRRLERELKKGRKKGAVIIEFLVVLPAYMLLIWAIMQLMLLMFTVYTAQESATETARMLAIELRGSDGGFPADPTIQENLKQKVYFNIGTQSGFNGFLLLFKNKEGTLCSDTPLGCPDFVLKTTLDDKCTESDYAKDRSICAYVKQIRVQVTNGEPRFHEQIVVQVRAKFLVIGHFIPSMSDGIKFNVHGVAQKELTDRFQYYEVQPRCYGSATGC